MLEIGAALAVATNAYTVLKSAFAAGRDLEQMSGDLGRWMSAVSDIDRQEKEAKQPSLLKRAFAKQAIEKRAIEVFAAKKRLEKQRQELKNYVIATHGLSGWDELVRLEGKIRKQRQQAIYEQREARQRFVEYVALVGFLIIIATLLFYFVWVVREARAF